MEGGRAGERESGGVSEDAFFSSSSSLQGKRGSLVKKQFV